MRVTHSDNYRDVVHPIFKTPRITKLSDSQMVKWLPKGIKSPKLEVS